MYRYIRKGSQPTWYLRYVLTMAALTLLLVLSACGSKLTRPGAEPTAQPVAVAENQQFTPTITLSPSSGYAGIYVQVTGTGWPFNMMVIVVLSDPNGISTTVATKDTDSSGNLTTGFLYPIDSRWLLSGPYTIAAESADGKYHASAQFTVVEPGAEAAPTLAPTATLVESTTPSAQPTATASNATSAPTSTSTPVPTLEPVVTRIPTPQVRSAEASSASNSQSPLLTAALVLVDGGSESREQYYLEVRSSDPNVTLQNVTAILLLPPLQPSNNIKLSAKDKVEIKINPGRLEIKAPDPQAVFDFIQQTGGIEVQPGQLIEYKTSPDHIFKATYEDDKLKIEASSLRLQVTALDATGKTYQVNFAPPYVSDGDDDDHEDDDHEDDEGEDD